MITLIRIATWFVSPIGRIAGLVLLVLAAIGAIYAKGRYDNNVAFKEKIERESTKAVNKADAARRDAGQRFDAGGLRDDGFRRDK